MCDEFDSGEIEVFDSGEDLYEDISLEDLSDVMDSETIEVEDFEMFDDTWDVGEESDIGSIMDETTEFSTEDTLEEVFEDTLYEEPTFEEVEAGTQETIEESVETSQERIYEDVQNQEIVENSAMGNMTEYMYEHNYGREDYETYSKDPEWQRLNNDLLEEMGQEPINYDSVGETESSSAMDNMTDYIYEHNYGREDYEIYSKDPEWQRLNNDLLEEMGQEPIAYDPIEESENSIEMDNVPEDTYEQDYAREDYETYSENPEEQELNNDILAEMEQEPINYEELNDEVIESNEEDVQTETGASLEEIMNDTEISESLENSSENLDEGKVDTTISDWMDEVDISNEEITDGGIDEVEVETSEVQYQIEHNTEFQNSLLENRPDLAEMFDAGEFYEQGNNEFGYEGTCGETTQANTFNRLLETNEFTENDVLSVAIDKNLCEIDLFDSANSGGTSTEQYMELYNEMNQRTGNQLDIKAFDYENALGIEDMASRLDEGSILNISVDSNVLWDQPIDLLEGAHYSDHWISVTGVERDLNGNIEGFKIVDSGGGESYLNVDKFEKCYYGETDSPVIDPTCIVVSKKGK